MAALPDNASTQQPQSKANDNTVVDYSKLDASNKEHHDVLSDNAKNYDVDHMNWVQIEYDAMHEGSILHTYQVIQEWINKFESSNQDSNESKTPEYESYLKEKAQHAKLIENINEHHKSLQTGFEQLFPDDPKNSLSNSNSGKNDNDEKTSQEKNKNKIKNQNKNEEEQWITQVDNYKGISVFYRKEKDIAIHSIKVQFKCKCSPLEFLATINEFDLIPEVVTIIPLECSFLKEYSDVDKVLWSKVKMWWPLHHRDVVVGVFAYDCLQERDSIVIIGSSVDESSAAASKSKIKIDKNDNNNENKEDDTKVVKNKALADSELTKIVPPVGDRTIRMDITWALGAIKMIKYDPNDSKKCEIEIDGMFNVDFKSFLPTKLLNWVTRTFAYYACQMVQSKCEQIYQSKKHLQRLNSKKVYKRIKRQLVQWNDAQNKKNENKTQDNKNETKSNDTKEK